MMKTKRMRNSILRFGLKKKKRKIRWEEEDH